MSATTQYSDAGIELIRSDLNATLLMQRCAYLAHPYPSLEERRADLRQLKAFIRDNRDAIVAAISADYGNRSRHETLFAEIFSVLDGVDYTLKHLKKWMKPQRRHVDMKNFFGASNRVIPQPLGVVGAIVPWNFPINLSFSGLIATFAAGNRSMVKMSENSRHLAKLLIDKCPTKRCEIKAHAPRCRGFGRQVTVGPTRQAISSRIGAPSSNRVRGRLISLG